MNIKQLKITNFRCFKDVTLDLHPELTVLVADNGNGKSTLLDVIRIALWPYIKGFDLARTSFNDPGNSITIADVRIVPTPNGDMSRCLPCEISTLGDYGNGAKNWCRYRDSEASNSKVKDDKDSKTLESFAKKIQKSLHQGSGNDMTLPVFGYYGTGRLWAQQSLSKAGKGEKDDTLEDDFYIRTFGYRNCTNPSSSYKHFKEWFIWACESLKELKDKSNVNTKELETAANRVTVVQQAINSFLKDTTGWHQLEYSITHQKSLILHHNVNGLMKVDQLSDGIRSILSMIGDIAYRCIKLNPHLGAKALEETSGVIMIDEVDMHLHPSWQQRVVQQLRKAFPKVQFIVTTHSPQVLTTVPNENIRIIKEGSIFVPEVNTMGEESRTVLEDVMEVSSRPKDAMFQQLTKYLERINRGDIDSGDTLKLREELDQHYGSQNSQLRLADMAINRARALKKSQENKG